MQKLAIFLSAPLLHVTFTRIGRTGRAGKEGTSHTFFQQCDKARAGELVKVPYTPLVTLTM
jgi:superfamily II DNA/RNA helicase